MAKKTVSLYVDDRSVRLMVSNRKSIAQWASVPLEPGLVKAGVVVDEEAVAATVRKLLKERDVSARRVVAGLSGLHSQILVIKLPHLPSELVAEAVVREAARMLPVPLEQLYLAWQRIPAPSTMTHVFAAAVPRVAVDSLLRTLRRAGLVPHVLDIKPLALARLAGEPNAVIVDVQATEFDIIIIGDGVPYPVRTIPLSAEGLPWPEKLSMIREDLVRTIEFYNANNPENPIAPDLPVQVTGDLADEPQLCQSLADELGRPLVPFSPPLEVPGSAQRSHSVVSVGLALKGISSKARPASLLADLDVLPEAYRAKAFSFSRIGPIIGVILAVAMIVPQVFLIQGNATDIDDMDAQLANMATTSDQRTEQLRELAEEIVLAGAFHGSFTAALAAIDKQQDDLNTTLRTVVNLVPDGVALADIYHDGSSMAIEVVSPGETAVLAYARNLEATGLFAGLVIVQMKLGEAGGEGIVAIGKDMHFILAMQLGEDAEEVREVED